MAARLFQFPFRILGIFFILAGSYICIKYDVKPQWYGIYHPPSLALVGLVLAGVSMFSYKIQTLFSIFLGTLAESPSACRSYYYIMEKKLPDLIDTYYSEGPSALAAKIPPGPEKKVWLQVCNKLEAQISPQDLIAVMNKYTADYKSRINREVLVAGTVGSLAPTIGVLGTVLGLIKLLGNLQDFSNLGSNMALALLTTLYGIVFNALLITPVVGRLEEYRTFRIQIFRQILYWLECLDQKRSGSVIEHD
jgi:chemotaxis protein MotA